LLRARRGPDYQFGNAAAVLLRVLGYPTRLVSGFYVAPEHYDPLTQHTPVVKEDLHFWAEVRLPSGDWLVIEPTPGYEVLGPNPPWFGRVLGTLLAAGYWPWEHKVAVILCVGALAGGWWKRRELLDALAMAVFRLFPTRSWNGCVRRVVWLLEWRGCWAGCPRPTSQTPSSWLRSALFAGTDQPPDLQQLTLMAEWSAYASDLTPPWRLAEVQHVCRRALDNWSLRRWRSVVAAGAGRGEHS
jgi:hypothetical protein